MDMLEWGKPGEKTFETGVNRGVLYIGDAGHSVGVPWNGLTSVEEAANDNEMASYYFDGIKYLDQQSPTDYAATLRAFTYPEEFEEFDGFDSPNAGLIFGNQPVRRTFGLSYQTRIGDDLSGTDLGYKIHLAYQLSAKPDARAYSTMGDSSTLSDFGWTISGIPQWVPGYRPTAHVTLDSRRLDPRLLSGIESILYGADPSKFFLTNLDGGTPDATGPDILDAGNSAASGSKVYDGGTPFTSGITLGPPGPRLPALTELVAIVNGWSL